MTSMHHSSSLVLIRQIIRSRFLLPLMTLTVAGCGGTVRPGPAVTWGITPAVDLQSLGQEGIDIRGKIKPVAAMAFPGNFLQIDLLVQYPDPPEVAYTDPTRWFQYTIYNGLQRFESIEGRGFAIRRCDGSSVSQLPFSDESVDHLINTGYVVRDVAAKIDWQLTKKETQEYLIAIVPILIYCETPIHPDDCIQVSIATAIHLYPKPLRQPVQLLVLSPAPTGTQ